MQNENPLVTIICSCFNHQNDVEKSLDAVLNQTYKNIQLIIVDDCSTDSSFKVIENWILKYNTGLFIKNNKNLGLTTSFNNAAKKAKGDFLVDLSADDILLQDCVKNQVEKFKQFKNETVGIVYGNARVTNKTDSTTYIYYDKFSQLKKTITPEDGLIYKEIINHTNTICSVSAMINKNVFDKLGGYDERLVYEDYDFWLRVSHKYPILYIDKILVERQKLKNSLGNTNYLRLNKKSFGFKYSTYSIVKKTFKMNSSKEENLASIEKIYMEIKDCLTAYNFVLVLKYAVLLLRFQFRKHKNDIQY